MTDVTPPELRCDLSTPEMRAAHWLSMNQLPLHLTGSLAMRLQLERSTSPQHDAQAVEAAERHYAGILDARLKELGR